MGANNSTCLPCKAAGATNRRIKAASGVPSPRDTERHACFLKKVSTAAEPRVGSEMAAPVSASEVNRANDTVASLSQPLLELSKIVEEKSSLPIQGQTNPLLEPTNGRRLQQEATENEQATQNMVEREKQQKQAPVLVGCRNSPKNVLLDQNKGSMEPVQNMEQLQHTDVLQHQRQINVPSHLLATEAELSWQQQNDSQQALLSPHSCSVAHRVAAALRAAAGERAAAAAARTAEAVEAAKTASKECIKQYEEPKPQHNTPSCCSTEFAQRRLAAESSVQSLEKQTTQTRQGQQHPSGHNICFPHVSCFKVSEDVGNEITVRQSVNQQQVAGSSPSLGYSVVGAAKRIGEILSAASAAAAGACQSAPGKTCAAEDENSLALKAQSVPGLNGEGWLVSGENSGELRENASVFLGAMDRAMDAISSEDFKKQAVTLLSQSVSVAASVVEAVKKCGDAPKSLSGISQSHTVTDREDAGYAPSLDGYYKALQISAQQQLAVGQLRPRLSAC